MRGPGMPRAVLARRFRAARQTGPHRHGASPHQPGAAQSVSQEHPPSWATSDRGAQWRGRESGGTCGRMFGLNWFRKEGALCGVVGMSHVMLAQYSSPRALGAQLAAEVGTRVHGVADCPAPDAQPPHPQPLRRPAHSMPSAASSSMLSRRVQVSFLATEGSRRAAMRTCVSEPRAQYSAGRARKRSR